MYTAKCSLSRPGPRLGRPLPSRGGDWGCGQDLPSGPPGGLSVPFWAGPCWGGLQPGASPDKCLASKRPRALGLTSVAWPPWRLWGAVPSQDPRWRCDSVGFLGSWGDGADVRHRPLAACGLVVVRAGALGVPLNWVPQAPAVRTGNATVGSFFPRCVTRYLRVLWAQTPPPCLAPRTVWATACLGGSPGRWTP